MGSGVARAGRGKDLDREFRGRRVRGLWAGESRSGSFDYASRDGAAGGFAQDDRFVEPGEHRWLEPALAEPGRGTRFGVGSGGVGGEADGVEGFYAAEADGGVGGVLAYVGHVAPAAVALGGGGTLDLQTGKLVSAVGCNGLDLDLRDVEELGEGAGVSRHKVLLCFADVFGDDGFQGFADGFGGAEGFEFGEDIGAKGEEGGPVS